MADEMDRRRRRAAYRASHRGTKEMDFILGRFAEEHLASMSSDQLADFERLLAMPDPVLSEWFSRGDAVDDGAFAALIMALRRYHGLGVDSETESEA